MSGQPQPQERVTIAVTKISGGYRVRWHWSDEDDRTHVREVATHREMIALTNRLRDQEADSRR